MPNSLDPRMIDPSKSAVTFTATTVVTPSGTSDLWNAASSLVQANSASWEESADILPTVTSYLSTTNVLMSGITITGDISATGILYSANTLTTSICAMSGNSSTPFVMQFTNGLLTSITF